jgi:hypothetical protein
MNTRLVSAEFLKLRKRRGLLAATLVLTVAPMLIAFTVLAGEQGPVGGMENFVASIDLLWGMSLIAAILVGSTLGTADVGAGVFRELVVTGRSRLALFFARVPAGLAFLLPIVGAGFAITATVSSVDAGRDPTGYAAGHEGQPGAFTLGNDEPGATLLIQSAGWLALVAASALVIALGVSSLLGSRGTSIGILLGLFLLVMPLLLDPAVPFDTLREGLFYAATDRLKPELLFAGAEPSVPLSLCAAIAVLGAWLVVPLGVGAWRTRTRDA